MAEKNLEQMQEAVAEIREKMAAAAREAGRDPAAVQLCAACKTRTAQTVAASAALPIDAMAIAKGLLSEDDYLLQEILFNPRTPGQVTNIRTELKNLLEIIENKDAEGMKKYLTKIREKIK